MKKRLLILTAIVTLLMVTGVSAAYITQRTEYFSKRYSLGESYSYLAYNAVYSTSNYTRIYATKSDEDAGFLFNFKVYDGTTGITPSGSLQRAQTLSSVVQYQSSSTIAKNLTLQTTLSKYCRFAQNMSVDWYVLMYKTE